MSKLAELTAEMVGMGRLTGDAETAHFRADAILIEAIRELYANPNYYTGEEVDALIRQWHDVPKWYA